MIDHQLNDLNDKLIFKMYHDPSVELRYFANGYIQSKESYIHKVYVLTQTLHLCLESRLIKIQLSEIIEIK
ncbi:YolD-like family protein [Staphylococcus xylosus]|uniref:YolD-like family protein n=1 Tax=Staphylococcus xylosus TaxID=1288 RepID=UPI002174FEAA|nr:YolD-like family protein [Staphylococcus xylosus]